MTLLKVGILTPLRWWGTPQGCQTLGLIHSYRFSSKLMMKIDVDENSMMLIKKNMLIQMLDKYFSVLTQPLLIISWCMVAPILSNLTHCRVFSTSYQMISLILILDFYVDSQMTEKYSIVLHPSRMAFLDALPSLEPTQVSQSVGDSFKIWVIGAL